MKTTLAIFCLLLILTACDETSEIASPCDADTPEANFKYETDKITVSWDKVGDYYYSVSYEAEGEAGLVHYVIGGYDTFAIVNRFHPGIRYNLELALFNSPDEPLARNRCNGKIPRQAFSAPCGPYGDINIGRSTTSATVSWEKPGQPPSKQFTLNVRKKGTTEITVIGTDELRVELTSLEPDTEYEVQLVSTCSDQQQYISEWFTFRTLYL